MELMSKPQTVKCQYKDVTFLVKSRATAYDKFLISMSPAGEVKGNEVKFTNRIAFFRVLVERFVVGWEGVTLDGKPAPYSFELLESSFPSSADDDVFIRLGSFVIENTDVFKRDAEIKNASGEQSNGAPSPVPSPAPALTA